LRQHWFEVHQTESILARQRNVQQQNELSFEHMLARSEHFRARGVPIAAKDFLATQGIDINTSVIVQAMDGYICGFSFGLGGILLTKDQRFFSFELETNPELTEVVFVHDFTEITAQQNMSCRNKGASMGFGALAVAVLRKLDGI
jgi:hypothetical protein